MRSISGVFAGLRRPLQALARVLAPLGTCGRAGLLAGLLVGFILMLESFAHPDEDVTFGQAVAVVGLLAAFAWVILVFVLVILERMTFASIALPLLVNVILVAGITVAIAIGLGVEDFAMPVGAIVGALVGQTLCRLHATATRGAR